jgi:D-hydroxyproline dehydrogenase subunit gamma
MNKTDKHTSARGPLFRPLREMPKPIQVELDGKAVMACAQETVASLLLRVASPESYRQSVVTGKARAPLCMMGVCFECLIEIDGQANQQGCLIPVRDGMRIRRQNGVQA